MSVSVPFAAEGCACPICGRHSSRAHSRYHRTVSDLPWHGVSVDLGVRARRFFCDEPSCERLPEIAARARKTGRLEEALLAIWLGDDLVVEYGGQPLSRYDVSFSPGNPRPEAVTNARLFATRHGRSLPATQAFRARRRSRRRGLAEGPEPG